MKKDKYNIKLLGIPEEKQCEYCGCFGGIHKKECLIMKRLDGY